MEILSFDHSAQPLVTLKSRKATLCFEYIYVQGSGNQFGKIKPQLNQNDRSRMSVMCSRLCSDSDTAPQQVDTMLQKQPKK